MPEKPRAVAASFQIVAPAIATLVFVASFVAHYDLLAFGEDSVTSIPIGSAAHEYLLRVVWGLSSSALVAVVVASIVLSVCTIYRNVPPPRRWWFAGASFVLSALLIALLWDVDLAGGAGKLLIEGGQDVLGLPVNRIVEPVSWLSGIAIVLILSSASAILCGVADASSEQKIRDAYDYWTANLIVTAAFLVVGSLQIRVLYQWMTATIQTDPAVAQALSLGSAILYTAILITIFLPTSIVLESRSRRLSGGRKKRSWFAANELDRSRLELVAKYSVMLAPAIFGAFAELSIWSLD